MGPYRLTLKLDSMQPTGSFKVRGAFSDLTKRAVPESGVVAASGGNFGLAVAYSAGALGHAATVFVPGSSPEEKVGRVAQIGSRRSRRAGLLPRCAGRLTSVGT